MIVPMQVMILEELIKNENILWPTTINEEK